MSIFNFLNALFEHGRVLISADPPTAQDQTAAHQVLADFERSYRLDLPGQPPAFSIETASFAANVFYRACGFAVQRDADADTIREALLIRCPEPPNPATHYSADIVLRFLPDLLKLTCAAAQDDPLVDVLLRLASAWPLSSVGVDGVSELDVAAIAEDECLLRLYVDRILSRKDLSRLRNQTVRDAVEASLGMHVDLAPTIAREIERFKQEECSA